jgi:hypothetical protein
MSRRQSVDERDTLTEAEYQHVLQVVDGVCGPRPPGTPMDPSVTSWKWARKWLRDRAERELMKRPAPATRQEVQEIVARYESSVFES